MIIKNEARDTRHENKQTTEETEEKNDDEGEKLRIKNYESERFLVNT